MLPRYASSWRPFGQMWRSLVARLTAWAKAARTTLLLLCLKISWMSLSRCDITHAADCKQQRLSPHKDTRYPVMLQTRGSAASLRLNYALFSLMRRGSAYLSGLPSCVPRFQSLEACPGRQCSDAMCVHRCCQLWSNWPIQLSRTGTGEVSSRFWVPTEL